MSSWNHKPDRPVTISPVFRWPWDFRAIARWFFDSWFWISEKLVILALAVICWAFIQPDNILMLWLRNAALMSLVAGGLHLWFYRFRAQADQLRYDARDLGRGARFTLGSQTADNIFWTLASGVTVWTVLEYAMLMALDGGVMTRITLTSHPIWFVALLFLIPIWESFWFYWIHRALHWGPLYRLAHALHHRNINVGPWSGLSMHPIEHVMFLGGVWIHLLLPSHELHIIFHLMYYSLSAATTHCGYEALLLRDKARLALGTFHHQMHHRYFECNYGSLEIPWDVLFGSFHDGTDAAHEAMRKRRARLGDRLGG